MSFTSANLGMPYLAAAQAQKHVTVNEAIEILDAVVQLTVVAFEAQSPPANPEDGQVWALGLAPTGDWTGQIARLAIWSNGGWLFVDPKPGWRAASGTVQRVFNGAAWVVPPLDLQNLDGVGIGAASDATNGLVVASPAALFTHDGAGHQLKINKAATSDTATLLFQTGFSGRAEFGLAGVDDFSVKVSADGASWQDALIADRATGEVSLPNGLSVSGNLSLPTGSLDLSGTAFSGTLPVAQGGTGGDTATAARTNLGLGSAATADVTTSATDTTAARLLKTGDWGLGGLAPAFPGGDLGITDNSVPCGFYRGGGVSNRPPTATSDGMLIHMRRAGGGGEVQLFSEEGFPQRLFTKGRTTGAWSNWRTFNPTLGTVTQTDGVPTGAIIQRGSNSNGEFVRFADGSQLCWSVITASNAGEVTWTYPAAFVGTGALRIVATANSTNTISLAPRCTAKSATSVNVSAFNNSNGRVGVAIEMLAIGRWF